VADFDYSQELKGNEIASIIEDRVSYQLLRANHQLIPISTNDFEGQSGKLRIEKNKLLETCGQSCDNGHCNGFTFSRYKLPV